jgi:hypothetical protein
VEPSNFLDARLPPPPSYTIVSLADVLPNLQYAVVGGLQVAKYAGTKPLNYLFDGFPFGVVYAEDNIQVTSTNASDLSFLSNVLCPPANFIVSNNAELTSLSGLNIWPEGLLKTVTMFGNPLLLRAGFQALAPVLQCSASSPPQITVSVTPADCFELTSVSLLCTYILQGCPPAPPPPPSPPPLFIP